MTSVAVIGGGHNGLVCATFLARAGLDVTVFEANEDPGGCIWTETMPSGHRIERGAIDHGLILPIAEELGLDRYGLEYVFRDTLVGAGFGDGTRLVFHDDLEKTIAALAADGDGYRRLAEIGGAMLSVLGVFATAPSLAEIAALGRVGAVDPAHLLLTSSRKVVQTHVADPHLIASLTMYGAQSQLPPWLPGTGVFGLLLAGSHGHPPGRPVGGSAALVAALVAALESSGGSVRTGSAVRSIAASTGGATVTTLGGDGGTFDRVVSTISLQRTAAMVTPAIGDLVAAAAATSSGALNVAELKVDLALSAAAEPGTFGHPEVIWMLQPEPGALDRAFGEIIAGDLPSRPCMMWAAPSALDADAAPSGQGTAWISAFVPAFRDGVPWDATTEKAAGEWLLDGFDAITGGDIRSQIVDARVTGPASWEERIGAHFGNPNHIDMTIDQLFSSRPPTGAGYRTPAPWLYLSGAGTYPGGGLSGLPGKNAATTLLGDLGRRPQRRRLGAELASLSKGWQLYRTLRRRT